MRKIRKIFQNRQGTTLVETMVTLLLISIMMVMAAGALSSASRIFVRVQRTEYAQSILDTVMTELRTITKDTSGYVKIYPGSGEQGSNNVENLVKSTGSLKGNTLEFINGEGYVVLVSTDGCEKTDLYIQDSKTGEFDAVSAGQLLTRYYFRTGNTYVFQKGTTPVARAVARVFGEGFYMGNYVKVTYAFPDGTASGDKVDSITATVTLYRDKEMTDSVAEDTEILEFKHPVVCYTGETAMAE